MKHLIKVPDIGEGIAEVELIAWHVNVGDRVVEDQGLADVMTEKSAVEIPSPISGLVVERKGDIGHMLAVGSLLLTIESDQQDHAAIATDKVQQMAQAPSTQSKDEAAKTVKTVMKEVEKDHGIAPSTEPSIIIINDIPLTSPSIRHRARQLSIDLRFVKGSGPNGRIWHDDLERYINGQSAKNKSQPDALIGPDKVSAPSDVVSAIPVMGLRRKIAERMQEAKRRIPHFSYIEEVDVTVLEATRQCINQQFASTRGKISLLPLLIRAIALAIEDFPQMNALYDDVGQLINRHSALHMGMATQTKMGLMVPVIRHAEQLSIWRLAAEITRLAQAARDGQAKREELSGSTLTITSLGSLGGIASTPIINAPEVAIIGINNMVARPVVKNNTIVIRQMMNLSSSFDHRVVDGMDAALFIQKIRVLLETPAMLFIAHEKLN